MIASDERPWDDGGDALGWVSPDGPLPAGPVATCDHLRTLRSLRAGVEARELVLVAHLCDEAPPPPQQHGLVPGRTAMVPGGADGTPRIPEFLHLELGPLLGTTPFSARRLIADVLDLRHRLPRLWQAVLDLAVPVSLARRVAALCATSGLSRDQARGVDEALDGRLAGLGFGRAMALAEAEVIRADPERARQQEERARTERTFRLGRPDDSGTRSVYARVNAADAVHLKAMVGRLADVFAGAGDERSTGEREARALGLLATPARAVAVLAGARTPQPALDGEQDPDLGQRAAWNDPQALAAVADALAGIDPDRLAPPVRLYVHTDADHLGPDDVARVEGGRAVLVGELRELLADSRVRLTQVIDHRESVATDAYEVPAAMRERMCTAQPFEVFPWSTRRSRGLDMDHTRPFHPGIARQTRPGNLGPLSRTVHRARTHGGFSLRQPLPGLWIWRTPLGGVHSVSNRGARSWNRQHSTLDIILLHQLSSGPGRSEDP
ncbi:hypothetical protein [Raineyella fluvialis]|uniref:DUF222 domain-containing protein n=1 Tax=Raineyella fluvialis TaxID=2662261 RepID=A0A5Q2FG82_9ACTN|nr:hypothetical protein [Raineyella fluvialis]QGF24534.1 hypothetical protein Rai3103_13745 [Raineyella fluvialis]